jgi:diadenosine tetraphosphate (Ap4A) HIT family hydrolase
MSEAACPFCNRGGAVLDNKLVYAAYDLNPVTPGHMLIIPIRHVATYFDASIAEKEAMWTLVERAKCLLDEQRQPAGYNIGINVGEVAGQTIAHAHLHLIPRYRGDTPNPRGGVRGVIPDKQSY